MKNFSSAAPMLSPGSVRSEESVLSGDYESYYGGLQYSQLYHNYSMPRGAPQVFPSSPSEVDVHALSTQQNWSMIYQMGTDLYVPIQTFYHPNASQQFEATFSFEEKGKSRGTGTYIPDMTRNSYKDKHTRMTRPKGSASVSGNILPKSHQKKDLLEIQSETDMNGDSKPFEITSEEFPLLSSFQKTSPPSEAQGFVQSNLECEQARSSSSSQLNIEFGTFRPAQSPIKPPLPATHDNPDSGISITLGTLLGVPRMKTEMKEKFSEKN